MEDSSLSDATSPSPAFSELQKEIVRLNAKVQQQGAELHKIHARLIAISEMLEEQDQH